MSSFYIRFLNFFFVLFTVLNDTCSCCRKSPCHLLTLCIQQVVWLLLLYQQIRNIIINRILISMNFILFQIHNLFYGILEIFYICVILLIIVISLSSALKSAAGSSRVSTSIMVSNILM